MHINIHVPHACTHAKGRNSDRVISYTNMWRTILKDRSAGIIDHLSFYDFLNKTVANEIFKPDYFESRYYSASSDTGVPFGSALLGTHS